MRPGLLCIAALLVAAALRAHAAAPAADLTLAVVLPAQGDHRIADLSELEAIFRRRRQYWPDGARIEPVNLPPDDPWRRRFSERVLGASPEGLEAYWNQQYFHGILPPHVFASPEAVLRFVAATPAAVGYVPLCSADARVRIALAIDAAGHVVPDPDRSGCRH